MHDPSAPQFHEHQDVPHRVVPQGLRGQVHVPQLGGVSGQERAPGGGGRSTVSCPGDHVPTDGAGSMLHPEFRLQLQGDTVLAPLGVIGRDAANQADVVPRD